MHVTKTCSTASEQVKLITVNDDNLKRALNVADNQLMAEYHGVFDNTLGAFEGHPFTHR